MCCKDEEYNFKLWMNGSDLQTTEEAGKKFAKWLETHVAWPFYKGLVENLQFIHIAYGGKE